MSISPLRGRELGYTMPAVRASLPAGFPPANKAESSHERITEYYAQLHSQVQRLDSKVEEILAKHELDFMSAFKVHIFGLQKQLLDLRRQLQEKETSLYKDQQIQSLSTTVQWFHEEGVKFAEILTRSKQETEKWKSKAQALEADTLFLERQVKSLKRKQRLWDQLRDKVAPSPLRKAEISESDPRTVSTKSTSPVRSMEFDLKSVSHPSVAELISKHELKDASLCRDLDELVKAITSKSLESIKHMQAALDRKTRKVQLLTNQKTQQFAAQSELQKLFVQCVDEVRKQCSSQAETQIVEEQFLAGDRRRIIELFCLNDAVFQEIYDRLFVPSAPPHPGFSMKSTPILPKVKPSPATSDPLTDRPPSHISPKKGAFAALFSKPSHR